jgi:hypothetical protein
LILVEGMLGAGKSTTAQWIASWLVGRGEDARAFHEFAVDHPVRSKAVDLLRASYPEPVWSPEDIGEDGLARDPRVYGVEQWGRLAQHCRRARQTVILESSFLQNSLMCPRLCQRRAGRQAHRYRRQDRAAADARAAAAGLPATPRHNE